MQIVYMGRKQEAIWIYETEIRFVNLGDFKSFIKNLKIIK